MVVYRSILEVETKGLKEIKSARKKTGESKKFIKASEK